MIRLKIVMTTAAAALTVALLLAPMPGLGQAPETDEAKAKAKAAAKAKQIALNFENNAQVLTLFDREGKTVGSVGERGLYNQPVLSPDRTRVATIKADPAAEAQDVWVIDVATGKSTRITTSKAREGARAVVWSPDGSQLAYIATRDSTEGVYRRASNGEGPEELLYKHPGAGLNQTDWSMDGKYLGLFATNLGGSTVWVLPTEGAGERKPIEVFRSNFTAQGSRLSPDGRFMSYMSNQSGRNEIYVRPFDLSGAAPSAGPWQVSDQGGLGMASWRRDGRELFYLAPDRSVMVVEVSTTPAFEFGKPKVLFRPPETLNFNVGVANVSRDGQRVLIAVPPATRLQQITVLDRQGKRIGTVGEPGLYGQPALSPDGTRVAVNRNDLKAGQGDIWVFDMGTGKSTAVTNDMPPEFGPIWSPDGKQVLYVSARENGRYQGIYRKAWDGTGSDELLFRHTAGAGMQLTDVSADGKLVTFMSGGIIFVVPLTGSDPLARRAVEFSREEFDTVQGRFSPDGRFMAFGSNEADPDKVDVYVRPFNSSTGEAAGGKVQVSKEGANGMLHWRSDMKELYWVRLDLESGDGFVMAADISTTPALNVGAPRVLFRMTNARQTINSPGTISRDAQVFVFTMMPAPAGAAR